MEAYYTPVKQMPSAMTKITRSSNQTREGDWICFNCHNLNFSFRKKCNRCKTQTRQQNESAALLISFYEKNYMTAQLAQAQSGCQDKVSHANTSANSQPVLTPQRINQTPEKIQKDLPSVSPLVKKYNAREETPMSEARSQSSLWGVTVRDFEDILGASGRSDEHEESQGE